MLHATYQGSRSYGFRQEDFFQSFPYISLCKQCDPEAGPGNIIYTNFREVY